LAKDIVLLLQYPLVFFKSLSGQNILDFSIFHNFNYQLFQKTKVTKSKFSVER